MHARYWNPYRVRFDPARFHETARLLLGKGAELTPRTAVALGEKVYADAQAMLSGKLDEVWQTRHRAVVLHDLAQHRRRRQAGHAGQFDRAFGVATALLAVLVLHQYNQLSQLRGEVADIQAQAVAHAREITSDSLEGIGPEVRRLTAWLHDFYKSADGLQRPEGLWIGGAPDYEGIGHWVFEVYLRNRLKGQTEDQARQGIETAIQQSDEWRSKHAK